MFGLLCFSAPGVGEATTEEAGLPLTPLWPPPNWSVRGHGQTGLCPREFEKEGSAWLPQGRWVTQKPCWLRPGAYWKPTSSTYGHVTTPQQGGRHVHLPTAWPPAPDPSRYWFSRTSNTLHAYQWPFQQSQGMSPMLRRTETSMTRAPCQGGLGDDELLERSQGGPHTCVLPVIPGLLI